MLTLIKGYEGFSVKKFTGSSSLVHKIIIMTINLVVCLSCVMSCCHVLILVCSLHSLPIFNLSRLQLCTGNIPQALQ